MGAAPLLLWAPSRLVRELSSACVPELQMQWDSAPGSHPCSAPGDATPAEAASDAAAPPPPLLALAFRSLGAGGLLAQVEHEAWQGAHLPLLLAAAQQCTLLTAVMRPLAAASTLEAAAASALAALGAEAARTHSLRVLALGGGARAPAERHLRSRLQQLGLGSQPSKGAPPLWCIQQQAETGAAASHVLIGLELAQGAAAGTAAAASAKPLSPTAMLPELAALSASLAGVRAGAVALDPFCGSGSLLVAAAQRGAALSLGSDIDASHFGSSGSGGGSGRPVLMQADAVSLQGWLPPSSVDALVTDLPYGYRTAVVMGAGNGSSSGSNGAASAEGEDDWQQLLGVLLQLAAHALVPGGRLLAWMPHQPAAEEQQRRQLEEEGQRQGLRLLHLLPETRESGYPRAIALFEQPGGTGGSRGDASSSSSSTPAPATDRRAALLAAVRQHAAGGGMLVLNLPGQQEQQQAARGQDARATEDIKGGGPESIAAAAAAVRQRGLSYKQVRGAAGGAAIDVWRAAWLGDTASIEEYAAAGGRVDAPDGKGQTALQFAAGYGREAAVATLLRLGADPCAAGDRSGMAALHRAAARNHTGALRLLLAAPGADCWQRSAAGQTPLHYAAQFGHEAAVELLLEHLSAAATADRSLRAHLALTDAAGLTPLHLAAQWGMAGVAAQLLRAGADVNCPSACERGLAPAHLAARWGHPAVLGKLQVGGGDMGRRSCCKDGGGGGATPLDEALTWKRAGAAEWLAVAVAEPAGPV